MEYPVLSTPMLEEIKKLIGADLPPRLDQIVLPDPHTGSGGRSFVDHSFNDMYRGVAADAINSVISDDAAALNFLREMEASDLGICSGVSSSDECDCDVALPFVDEGANATLVDLTRRIAESHLDVTTWVELVFEPMQPIFDRYIQR